MTVVGPDDAAPRPAVLLFHGCGGLRDHLPRYAEVAKAAGWRAFVIDSYGPRGWGRAFTLTAVCTACPSGVTNGRAMCWPPSRASPPDPTSMRPA